MTDKILYASGSSQADVWYYRITRNPSRGYGCVVYFFRKDLYDKFGEKKIGSFENVEDSVLAVLLPGMFESVSLTVFETLEDKKEVVAKLGGLKWFYPLPN